MKVPTETKVPDYPDELAQQAAIKYMLSYPAYTAKYLEGIKPLAFSYPYSDIFAVMLNVSKKGVHDSFAMDVLQVLGKELDKGQNYELWQKAIYIAYGLMMPDADQRKGANICLSYSVRMTASFKIQELQASVSDNTIDAKEAVAKADEIRNTLLRYTTNGDIKPISIKDKVERDFLIFDSNNVGTLALGNVYQIAGLPKSGKSKMVEVITASCMGCTEWGLRLSANHPRIKTLIFDTEMDVTDDLDAMRRINKLAGLDPDQDHFDKYAYYNVTEEDDILEQIIAKTQAEKPDLIIIDGLNDLLEDPNDLSTSKNIIKRLNQFAKTSGGIGKPIAIVWLLHLNQSEGANKRKAGGHSGSQSTMKVAGGWIVEIDEDSHIIKATNNVHRHKPIEPIYIKFAPDGGIYNAMREAAEYEQATAMLLEQKRQDDIARRAEATKMAARRKAYDLCKSLHIWNGEPISEDQFISAYLPLVQNKRGNATRKLKNLIESGIVARCEDDPQMLILFDPQIDQDAPF